MVNDFLVEQSDAVKSKTKSLKRQSAGQPEQIAVTWIAVSSGHA